MSEKGGICVSSQPQLCIDMQLESSDAIIGRNKSSDTLKSSLKVVRPSLVRANSEPMTHKTVHFSSTNLEDIRPFRRTQSPSAVSRKNHSCLPQWDFEDDDEDEYENDSDSDSESEHEYRDNKQHIDDTHWTLLTPKFSPHAMGRISAACRPVVYLDNVTLTPERDAIKAVVYVRNICFQKYVALRYTINKWNSFVETQGKWSSDIRKFDRDGGYDRFDITLNLNQFSEQVLNTNCIEACVRFLTSDSVEYWDNNNGHNYEFYLRNPSVPSHGTQCSPNLKQKAFSAIALPSYINDDESDEYYDLSTSDYLKRVGVRARPRGDNGIFDRYSFAASYQAVPDKENASIESKVAAPEEPEKKKSRPPIAPPQCSSPTSVQNSPTSMSPDLWESDSYKDFISRYCFFTPEFLGKPETSKSKKEEATLPINTQTTVVQSPPIH